MPNIVLIEFDYNVEIVPFQPLAVIGLWHVKSDVYNRQKTNKQTN